MSSTVKPRLAIASLIDSVTSECTHNPHVPDRALAQFTIGLAQRLLAALLVCLSQFVDLGPVVICQARGIGNFKEIHYAQRFLRQNPNSRRLRI
jgi:hypothetical protein